jgi:hypothetical protein
MRVTLASQPKLDPEAICTRVVARLIEEVACVCITPDSPAWQDIVHLGKRVGELRVYRGRGRVQKIVSADLDIRSPAVDAHCVAVFTDPASPIPHLVLESVHIGTRVSVHLDLLPKRDLGVSLRYVDVCYEPLSGVRKELDRDTRFAPADLSRRARSLLSPWNVAHVVDASDVHAALGYIDRYVSHWAGLLKSDAAELRSAPELAARDAEQRKLLFRRGVDPVWDQLEHVVDAAAIEQLISAFASA